MSAPSRNPDNGAHAAAVMLKDMAMEQPVTGIVGDEGNVHEVAREQQYCIRPRGVWLRFAVPLNNLEGMAVKVHGMVPDGIVVDAPAITFAKFELEYRIHIDAA